MTAPKVNLHLTGKGIRQAQQLANSLKKAEFELIVTPEFPRTKETARIVNQYHDAPSVEDTKIYDIRTGFEGRPVSQFREARRNAANRWTVRLNGGESFEDEKSRVQSFLNVLKKRPESSVLVVTHQAIARIIYAVVNNLPNEKVTDLEVGNTDSFEIRL